ncbi:BspA family leucine-rich repeat surface protein [Levilactobacillus paucivorans]|uniref:BspA family leucine-rich repeat surface protein n=1 Tax=Levilactobacillus paucivorans TaxID=616990 RepID=UPI00138F9328|nr:BspA family leucine-rich repeat surface protein [Levilactobacillus paucivorans]
MRKWQFKWLGILTALVMGLTPVIGILLMTPSLPVAASTTGSSTLDQLVANNASAVSGDLQATSSSTNTTGSSAPTSVTKASLARATTTTDIASGTNGSVTWRIDSAGVLHLSGGSFEYLPAAFSPWANDKDSTIPANIGGNYAAAITAISVEGEITTTAKTTQYSFLFAGLPNVTTVTGLDKLNMAGATTSMAMFKGDTSLTSVNFGNNDFSSDTDTSWMFQGDTNLTSVSFSNNDFSSVTNASSMFQDDTNLSSVQMPNADFSANKLFTQMFRGDTSLTSLDMSNWNVSKVTSMQQMFYGCSALTNVTTTGWQDGQVTSMTSMFDGCSALTTVTTADWQLGNVTSLSRTFANCSSLTTLETGKWNTSSVQNFNSLFLGDSKLATVDVANWDTSQATNIGYLFYNCTVINGLSVGNWDTSGVTVMSNTFGNCRALTSLDVADWNTSQVQLMDYLFSNCLKLSSVDVAKWDTSKVTTLKNAFSTCPSLTSLDVSKWDTSAVTKMDYVFNGDAGLTALPVSGWDTSKVTALDYAFLGCKQLTSLDLSNWDTSKVTSYTGVFQQDSKLQHLTLGKTFDFHGSTAWGLPAASAVSPYSGKWQLGTDGPSYSATDLMTTYDGSTMAGQYNWGQEGRVTVRYVDTDGTSLASDEVLTGDTGTAYTTTPKTFSGYTLSQTPANATGKFSSTAATVTYVYQGELFFSNTPGSVDFGTHVLTGIATTYSATASQSLAVQDNRSLGSQWTLMAQLGDSGFTGVNTGKQLAATVAYQNNGIATTIGNTATPVLTHTTGDHLPVDISSGWTTSNGLILKASGSVVADSYSGTITWTLTNSVS